MGGPRAVDDVVVRGIQWSTATWLTVVAVSVVVAVVVSVALCRSRSRRGGAGAAGVPPVLATAVAGGMASVPVSAPSSPRGEKPVTERLAEVRRLQGAGLITTEQADRRVREILAEV